MSQVVAKLLLKDPFDNPSTLLVKVAENQVIGYSLSGTVSRIAFSITNLNMRKALPDLMLDFKDTNEMIAAVKESIKTGTSKVTETSIYNT